MKLFNEYKNQVFMYLTSYINACYKDPDSALYEDDFKAAIDNILLNASENITDSLINKNYDEDVDAMNANIFYRDPYGKIKPIITNDVPVLTSFAERAWLSYVLEDPKAELFLDRASINALQSNISFKDGINPISSDTIDIRYPSGKKPRRYSAKEISDFRIILQAITEHHYISFTYESKSGTVYQNNNVVPFRFEYNVFSDEFSISIWNQEEKRPVKMLFENISNPLLGEKIKNYDSIKKDYDCELLARRVKEPVKLIIQDYNNGFDRTSFILSSYDRVSYRTEENEINMELYYYTFQEDELINSLLFLGKTVRIISPENIKTKYITKVQNSLKNYN